MTFLEALCKTGTSHVNEVAAGLHGVFITFAWPLVSIVREGVAVLIATGIALWQLEHGTS